MIAAISMNVDLGQLIVGAGTVVVGIYARRSAKHAKAAREQVAPNSGKSMHDAVVKLGDRVDAMDTLLGIQGEQLDSIDESMSRVLARSLQHRSTDPA